LIDNFYMQNLLDLFIH